MLNPDFLFLMMLIKLSGGNKIMFMQSFPLSDSVQNYEITFAFHFLFYLSSMIRVVIKLKSVLKSDRKVVANPNTNPNTPFSI